MAVRAAKASWARPAFSATEMESEVEEVSLDQVSYSVHVSIDELLVRKDSYVLRCIHQLLGWLLESVGEDSSLLAVDGVVVELVLLEIVI